MQGNCTGFNCAVKRTHGATVTPITRLYQSQNQPVLESKLRERGKRKGCFENQNQTVLKSKLKERERKGKGKDTLSLSTVSLTVQRRKTYYTGTMFSTFPFRPTTHRR
jgi:hypothetical protein